MKLHMHNYTIVIYIQYKFHEISFIGYLVMADDGQIIEILGNEKVINPL